MGAASRGLREHDDGTQDKIIDPELAEESRVRGRTAVKHALLTALVATVTFALLA